MITRTDKSVDPLKVSGVTASAKTETGIRAGTGAGIGAGTGADTRADTGSDTPTEAQSSLPLFDDPMAVLMPASVRTSERVQVPARPDASINAHLLEARRLARRMRRLRNQREEQTRTGQAICHHLKAMLTESRPHS